jgi:enamine deaminase RidA (YjgF/YER057c/UK114 family)
MIIRKQSNDRMSQIVEYNGVIYLAGIVSDDKNLDIKGQAKRVLEMAEERLANAGSDKENIFLVPNLQIGNAYIQQHNNNKHSHMNSKARALELVLCFGVSSK